MMGGSRDGPDFFNLHRNKRSITLNLKKPDGGAILEEAGRRRRRADRELSARRQAPARHRLRDAAQDQSAPRLRQPLRLRPGRALRQAAGLRPDRAGHGRPDVDHRTAGPGAGARRHPHRRPVRAATTPPWAPSSRCSSARSRARGSGCRPRCCRRRSPCSTSRPRAGRWRARCRARPATTIRPASRPACSRPATATSTSRRRASTSTSASARRSGAESLIEDPTSPTATSARRTASALNAEIGECTSATTAPSWSRSSTRPACRRARSTRSTRCSPTRRSSTSAWPSDRSIPTRGTDGIVNQAMELSRTPSRIDRPTPELGEHTDEVLGELGYDADAIADLRSRKVI